MAAALCAPVFALLLAVVDAEVIVVIAAEKDVEVTVRALHYVLLETT